MSSKSEKKEKQQEKPSKKKAAPNNQFLKFFHEHETSLLVSLSVLVAVFLALGVTAMYMTSQPNQPEEGDRSFFRFLDGDENTEEELPAVLPRRIDGIEVAREAANRVPACVMIENAAFDGVRPQSGLSRASVVYEVIVEGGITRFMAVFAGEESEMVGPVRSSRDTYLEFVSEYNCAYMHAGGSFTSLRAIPRFGLRDVDGLREPKYFWRQSGKFAPHNLFTSTDNLYQSISEHGWADEEPLDYVAWNFVEDPENIDALVVEEDVAVVEGTDAAEGEEVSSGAQQVSIFYGGAYNVEYNYNADEAYYERTNGKILQRDAVNDEVLSARNVVVMHTGDGTYIQGKGRVNWPVTGEGAVEVYNNGQRHEGVWRKNSRTERTEFFDADGELIPMARGNTWISLVPPHIIVENN